MQRSLASEAEATREARAKVGTNSRKLDSARKLLTGREMYSCRCSALNRCKGWGGVGGILLQVSITVRKGFEHCALGYRYQMVWILC